MPSHDSPKTLRGEGKSVSPSAVAAVEAQYDSSPYPIKGKRNGTGSS